MIYTLPFEIMYDIFYPLSYHEIVNFCRAYPKFARIYSDDVFWKTKLNRIIHPTASEYVILYGEPKSWASVYERWETMSRLGTFGVLRNIIDFLPANVDYIMWLLMYDTSIKGDKYDRVLEHLYSISIRFNNLNLLKKLISLDPSCILVSDSRIIDMTAEFAQMHIVSLLEGTHYVDLANAACKFGRIDILEYLKTKRIMPDNYDMMMWDRKVNVFDWLEQLGHSFDSSTANVALMSDKLDILQWLDARDIYPSQHVIDTYVNTTPNSDILNWLAANKLFPTHNMKVYFHFNTSSKSSKSSKLLILNWLVENDIYPKPLDVAYAIHHNLTLALQWLFDIGTALGTGHANEAIEYYRMDTLRWMGDHKIYPDQDHINAAFIGDNHSILHYLKRYNLYPNTAAIRTVMSKEAYSKLEWLYECGVFITQDDLIYAALYGSHSILKYLLSKGLYPSAQSMNTIIYYGRIDILHWYATKRVHYRSDYIKFHNV